MLSNIIFGGIEGGGSFSSVAILNGKGECLSQCSGPGTNFLMLGMEEAQRRIIALIIEAKEKAKIPDSTKIRCMCLSLSGAEKKEINEEFKKGLIKQYPHLCDEYVICSDTEAPVAAALEKGGVVLISGTGSNGLLINPDGSRKNCGGWGHMMGDEGAAYWIAHKALKIHFDKEDELQSPPHDYSSDVVWETAKEFFNVENRLDMLPHLYSKFQKPAFAMFCKELSIKASAGDLLCKWVFKQAGIQLAKHIQALSYYADESLLDCEGGLPVVCVGSVWKSWELMKPGFIEQLVENKRGKLKEVSLINLTTSAAVGATYIAAKSSKYDLPRDCSKNCRVFFHLKFGDC